MGADNWAACPRCLARARAKEARELAAVMQSYGNVPVAEFDAARASVKPAEPHMFTTFREDCEIYGAETGAVKVNYGGTCETCGLHLEFSETHPIDGIDA